MIRRIFAALLIAAVASGTAYAGDNHAHGTTGAKANKADKMAAMKAEMMKCSVCKNMAANWDAFGPTMKTETIKLNNGFAMMHIIGDATKVATFHSSCDMMDKAGGACMTMTDEQASKELCSFCQGIRSVVKAGGTMSTGKTPNGGMMVLTSTDTATVGKIMAMCDMMSGEMASSH